ncbi:MAG: TraB/GumN family protein [Bacteroidota bacterium]
MHKTITKHNLIVIILLMTGSLIGQAQEYKKNAIFWQVSGNGLEKPSYIMAILKFIPESDYILPAVASEKIKECRILSTETLLDHRAKHELNKAAHLQHNESLKDYLSKEEFQNLESLFKDRFGIGKLKFEMVYSKFKPVMLSTTMTRLALKENVKFYELELINLANENGMIMLGLETVKREVEAFERFSMEDQVNALKHTITNFDQQIEDYQQVVDAYTEGDLHTTLEYTLHPVENNRMFKTYFIERRNAEWMPKMIGYMKQAPTFFAIGASHLADEKGLLSLLEEQGYEVKPMEL